MRRSAAPERAGYRETDPTELWWCTSHHRRATHICGEHHCCDPKLGGIMLPCNATNVTGLVTEAPMVISREDYQALGQVIADMHPTTPANYEFKISDTAEIQLGKAVIVEANGKIWVEGRYHVADGLMQQP